MLGTSCIDRCSSSQLLHFAIKLATMCHLCTLDNCENTIVSKTKSQLFMCIIFSIAVCVAGIGNMSKVNTRIVIKALFALLLIVNRYQVRII